MRTDADVVVVGAGVAGLATARAAARAGRGVLVLEQLAPDHTRGSSHGTSRIFRLNYPDERYVRMAQSALEGWKELEAEYGMTLIEPTGALDLGPAALDNARALAACGARFEELRGAEVTRRFGIACSASEPALFQPDGGLTRADRALHRVPRGSAARRCRARHRRARRVDRRRACERAHRDDRRLRGRSGRGRHRRRMGATAARAARHRARRRADARDGRVRRPPARRDAPAGDRLRAASAPGVGRSQARRPGRRTPSLRLASVSRSGCTTPARSTDPDDDPPPDDAIASWALTWAHGRYPDAGAALGSETCIYTNTADEGFVLERHGRVVVGSACSGHGFKFAPLVGRTLAALAAEAARYAAHDGTGALARRGRDARSGLASRSLAGALGDVGRDVGDLLRERAARRRPASQRPEAVVDARRGDLLLGQLRLIEARADGPGRPGGAERVAGPAAFGGEDLGAGRRVAASERSAPWSSPPSVTVTVAPPPSAVSRPTT